MLPLQSAACPALSCALKWKSVLGWSASRWILTSAFVTGLTSKHGAPLAPKIVSRLGLKKMWLLRTKHRRSLTTHKKGGKKSLRHTSAALPRRPFYLNGCYDNGYFLLECINRGAFGGKADWWREAGWGKSNPMQSIYRGCVSLLLHFIQPCTHVHTCTQLQINSLRAQSL